MGAKQLQAIEQANLEGESQRRATELAKLAQAQDEQLLKVRYYINRSQRLV